MTDALAYFSAKLAHETDASDVYAAQQAGDAFVLVDVRSADAWAQGHAVGAVHVPYRDIAARAAEFDPAVPVVVYCWSPGCNAGAKGAVEFAKLGFSVREMIGGYEYWAREGYPVEGADGPLPRVFDPLVMYVRP
ncbi:rhodanese-like domain-containing protein [Microbacterium paulum]